jgi:hypothetical protein
VHFIIYIASSSLKDNMSIERLPCGVYEYTTRSIRARDTLLKPITMFCFVHWMFNSRADFHHSVCKLAFRTVRAKVCVLPFSTQHCLVQGMVLINQGHAIKII